MRVGSFHVIPAAVAGSTGGGHGHHGHPGAAHHADPVQQAQQQAQMMAAAAQQQQQQQQQQAQAQAAAASHQQQQLGQQAQAEAALQARAAQQAQVQQYLAAQQAAAAAMAAQQQQQQSLIAQAQAQAQVQQQAAMPMPMPMPMPTRISPLPPSFYGPAAAAAMAAPGGPPGAASAVVPAPPLHAHHQQQLHPPHAVPRPPATWVASQVVPAAPPSLPPPPPLLDPATGAPYRAVQDRQAAWAALAAAGHAPAAAPLLPTYNGINPNYPGVRLLSDPDSAAAAAAAVPPIYAVDDFLTPSECDYLLACAGGADSAAFLPAPVVGSGAGVTSPARTSSTVYLSRADLPLYLEKVCRLTGRPRAHCELPQVGRYRGGEEYREHHDAFDLATADGRRFAANGGQRVATVLVYLNDVPRGGSTHFPVLNLDVRPKKGMAVVFFPATVDGLLDRSALHAARPAVDAKYVSQVWIRQGPYDGVPSRRIFASEDEARRAAVAFCGGGGAGAGGGSGSGSVVGGAGAGPMPIEGLAGGGIVGGEVVGGVTSAASSLGPPTASARSSAPTSGNGGGPGLAP